MRNRFYPINGLSYDNDINEKLNLNNIKKVTKLKWNEDKQELEYTEKDKFENSHNFTEKNKLCEGLKNFELKPNEYEIKKQSISSNNGK